MNSGQSWHSLEVKEVLTRLQSNATIGISQNEAKSRLNIFGENALPEALNRTLFSIFLHQFFSPLIYLLLAASLIAFLIGEIRDAMVILTVVFLNAIIGSFQEGRAEKSLNALRKLSSLKSRIIRNGNELIVEARQIVPGDLLILSSGDAVPADARLIECSSLTTSEAALTGESLPVSKSISTIAENQPLADRHNMVYAGTYITTGRALAVTIATGINNEIGKIAQLTTKAVEPKTKLEQQVAQFGKILVYIALSVFCIVIIIGLIRGISFSEIFMIAISQMVSLVPEGLPVAMTIALAVGVQRMAKQGTVVRRLTAVEALGSITVICSDKTGTLTLNEMAVTSIYLPFKKRLIEITGVGYIPEGLFVEDSKELQISNEPTLVMLLQASALCNDAQILGPDNTNSRWRILGDPTEGALLTAASKANIDIKNLRTLSPRIAELPFNSDSKLMATQHKIGEKNLVYIKGAPESLLPMCNNYYCDGEVNLFDSQKLIETTEQAKTMANLALRILAVGFIAEDFIDGSKGFSEFKGKVTLLGLVGEIDPPRTEVANSVAECRLAGIKPIMITGDHKSTAVAIAKKLGIYQQNDLAIEGEELDRLTEDMLAEKIKNISIFARVQPAQKLRIVEAFQSKGEIVAMTGDGVNDAPALARADVGVAMGITGTEVAKEAAKIVITDDNFSTIVTAVAEGRLVYQNLKKLILFLFVTSIDEVVILFLALLFGYPPPLAAVQILWINLVTEGTLTVNLIMEPAEGDEMTRPPVPSRQALLDKELLLRVPLMALISVICTFGWFVYRSSQGIHPDLVQSETFTMLAVCQWFNVLNCRSNFRSALTWDLFKNPWLFGGLVLANLLHFLVIYWPPLSQFFHTVAIDFRQFIEIGIVASLVLWTEEFRKFFIRKQILKKSKLKGEIYENIMVH